MIKTISRNHKESPRLEQIWIASDILKSNHAGEDHIRPLTIYLPKAVVDPKRRFPVLYCLAPWTSAGRSQFDWQPFRESLFDRLTRLIEQGHIPPCIVVSPDLYTSLGGSQYINSEYLGRHGDHLVEELFPFIEQNYPVLEGPQHRAAFGRSSGGYGALRLAMDYPGSLGGIACHSADMAFDLVYKRDLIDLCNGLASFKGDIRAFLEACSSAVKLSGQQVHLLMLLGMAASYSPNLHRPEGFDLPIDLKTGVIDEEVWHLWLAHDPVHLIEKKEKQDALRMLNVLYVECGNRDQYNLLYGARQLTDKLTAFGIDHQYLEFDDNHSGTSYRYDVSLPLLLGTQGAG